MRIHRENYFSTFFEFVDVYISKVQGAFFMFFSYLLSALCTALQFQIATIRIVFDGVD